MYDANHATETLVRYQHALLLPVKLSLMSE